jgi:CBS domain-containing protein
VITGDRSNRRIPRDQALDKSVGELMITHPKTFAADSDVGQVRDAFEHSSQRVVLLADDGRFCGAIERGALDPQAPADAPAAPFATTDVRSVTPSTTIADAVALLDENSEPRLIVLDDDGRTLCGLLCFNQGSASFCVE